MADDLFAGEDQTPVIDETKNYYEDLVGDGKKFKTPEDLAKAKAESDLFIARLVKEQRERDETIRRLEDDLNKRKNEQEFLDRMEAIARQKSLDNQDPPVSQDTKEPLKPEDVEAIMERREAERRRKANLDSVSAKLLETFGDGYRTHVQKQSQALGMTTSELTELAAKNPQAFYMLVGIREDREDRTQIAPPRSSVTPSLSHQTNKKTYDYWAAQRKEKGESWYFTEPVQQEIWRSLQEMGEAAFYNKR